MAGFDCEDYYLEHCFLVQIPRSVQASVDVFEVFGRVPSATETSWAPEVALRAQIAKAKWDVVSGDIRSEFNRRLKSERKKTGSWAQGNNGVQRLLGKELLVLIWAVEQEDVSIEHCEVALRNWLGLKPEERWWLYTMTAATTGLAYQVGLGWRDALRQALCFGTRKDVVSLSAVVGKGQLPPRKNTGMATVPDGERRRFEFQALRSISSRSEAIA